MGSAKPLQNINENATIEEIVIEEKPDEKSTNEETEEEEEDKNTEGATVHIDQDSSHISLSACNYDHALINYLQSHPLTTK